MRFPYLLFLGFVASGEVALAQPFDGLTTEQREWQNTSRFYDDWQRDIRNRGGSGANSGGLYDYAAEAARKEAEWQRWLAGAEDRRREQKQAIDEWYRQRENEAIARQAQIEYAARRARELPEIYRFFLESGGRGTREMPPTFQTDAQEVSWYLNQAEAGDPHAAFLIGRLAYKDQNYTQAAAWLEKSGLADPSAAAIYGSMLIHGHGVPVDATRGRAMLEKAATEDSSGSGAALYADILLGGRGVPADVPQGLFYLAQAIVKAEQPSLLERIDPDAPWGERGSRRMTRRANMRVRLKAEAGAHPEAYVAAMEFASRERHSDVFGTLGGAVGEMESEAAREVYLAWLRLCERRVTPWGLEGRVSAIEGLDRKGHPDAAALYLLPDSFHRTADSFIPHSEERAAKLWEENGGTIEQWSQGNDAVAPRAARALLAREMGRWPTVSPRQSPQAVLAKLSALRIESPFEALSGEVLDGVFTANPQWRDKDASLRWLDELAVLDASFKPLRELYLRAPGMESLFGHSLDPVLLAIRDALSGSQEFSATQLAAAEAERNAAARQMYSDPQVAFERLLEALRDGDALAGWQLLVMADGKFRNIHLLKEALLGVIDARLQRDAAGGGDRAATAALALHFLHHPDAPGREWRRGWVPPQTSTVDWLQLAEQKGHPWALAHSARGHDAASKVRNKYGAEAQKIWPWLAENHDALKKTELWQRDVELLELFSDDRTIEFLREPLRLVEVSEVEKAGYADTISRLASARGLLAAYETRPSALDDTQAAALYETSVELAQLDGDEMLPIRRVQRLELLVESAIMGHAYAPLTVGALLKEPGFPLEPQPEEAQQWLEVGRKRLIGIAEKGAPSAAMDAARFLASEFRSGETFARDDAQAMKYTALAATLGDARAASTLAGAYRYGNLGLAPDPNQVKHWSRIADDVMMGRYTVPAAVLAGRPEDPPRPPEPAEEPLPPFEDSATESPEELASRAEEGSSWSPDDSATAPSAADEAHHP